MNDTTILFNSSDLSRTTYTLNSFSKNNKWVAWKEQPNKQGKPTKVPKNPHSGDDARIPTDPSTYGTLDDAIACKKMINGNGGVGIVLGSVNNDYHLVGIDLDSCRNEDESADWALKIIERFDTYAEIPPSETGIKLFFLMRNDDWNRLHDLIGGKTRKPFSAGEHKEVAIDTARFYTVTAQRLENSPVGLRVIPFSDVEWFISVAGVNYLARQRKFNGIGVGAGNGRDESGSGYGFRFMLECHNRGMSQVDAIAAIRMDSNQAGEWAGRSDQRQLDRAWESSNPFVTNQPEIKSESPKCSLEEAHAVFFKWLGKEYDLDVLDAMLATIASERLTGDPLWLLIIGGPGATKTETVSAAMGAGAHVTSTIASEGALLSGTSAKNKSANATGGLLRKIGGRGVLVIKDVTSIISADRNVRSQVLAAIREIYDGRWDRNIGSDGGRTLTWTGRISVIGAVTTAWDSAHSVVASMGDRFVNIRIDSEKQNIRKASGLQSIRNTGSEVTMRKELADAVGGVIAGANTDDMPLTEEENLKLLDAANIVTMARTAVEHDYKGDVIDSHAPEMPTRFVKQLAQMVRGGVAIGMTRDRAMRLAIRCAKDSIPPLRIEILLDIAQNPGSQVSHVRKRINKPWTTIRRELQGLHMLGMLRCEEEETMTHSCQEKLIFCYSLAEDFDRTTLLAMTGKTAPPKMWKVPLSSPEM
jgi:hypothetical protein